MGHRPKPVPKGFHTITPHLTVKDAAAAITFYKQAFGAAEKARSYAPDGVTLVHAELKIGDSRLFLSDEFPELGVLAPTSLGGSPTSLHLYVPKVDAVWSRALAAGAIEVSPLHDAFWGDRYGKIIDPFGHYWSLASRVEKVKYKGLARRSRDSWGKQAEPDESEGDSAGTK